MAGKKQISYFFLCFTFLILSIFIACSSSNSSKKPGADIAGLPPDPGESGMQTIAGVDSDSDGVRDDIQRYIAITYPDKPEVQKAMTQYVKADHDYILNGDDPVKARDAALKVGKALDCLFFRDPENASVIFDKIHAEFLNTKERILASDKVDSLLSGQVFSSAKIKDRAKSCDDYQEMP